MMHVVMAGDYPLDPLQIRGGVESVTYQLAQGLARTGEVRLDVVTRRKEISTYRKENGHGDYTLHLLPSPRFLPNMIGGPTIDRWRLSRLYRALSPDLIHAHGQEWYADAAFRAGLPTVVTAHGIRRKETVLFGRSPLGLLRGRFYNLVEASVFRRTQHLILISPYVAEQVRPWYRGYVHPIDNPVDDLFFSLNGQVEQNQIILFVGNLSPRKRLPHLLRAYSQIAGQHTTCQLFIVGHGQAERVSQLKTMAEDMGIGQRVTFTGPVSEQRLLELYSQCTMLVLSSIEETAPVVIAQAMAAGKPVVATRVGGVPYMVSDGETGYLVEPDNPQALADRILHLLADAELQRALGERARAEAQRRFSLSSVCQKTLETYRSVLAGGIP